MSSLPSYEEATESRHWLQLIVPYICPADYHSLCLVDRRSRSLFAPCLWRDIFRSARQAGLDPADDIAWWLSFVFDKLKDVSPQTRALVRILDARSFAVASYNFTSYQNSRTLQQSFRQALTLCPSIESIVLDNHQDIDPTFLIDLKQPEKGYASRLRALSIVSSSVTPLPITFFSEPALRDLLYLDASTVPGAVQSIYRSRALPALRILKLRGREVDDESLNDLAKYFKLQLWSLDMSENKITDASIDMLRARCIPITTLRSKAHFRVEGEICHTGFGAPEHGPFLMFRESDNSGSFDHPERYFVDAPVYSVDPNLWLQEHPVSRKDGRGRVRKDSIDAVTCALAGCDGHFDPEDLTISHGLTHLNLSKTRISSVGIGKLLRTSNGYLEDLDVACNPLLPLGSSATVHWPKSASLHGHIDVAHLLRPVVSSNLRVLKVHHSAVTQILSLGLDGMSTLARDYLAETVILNRAEESFAQPFTPEMNPRLASLTLTCIPRRSSGPLTTKLIEFLKTLSLQERAVQDAEILALSGRSAGILRGLRHVRLEFEPDAREQELFNQGDIDAEDLLIENARNFTFFEDERLVRSVSGLKVETSSSTSTKVNELHSRKKIDVTQQDIVDQEYVTYNGHWDGNSFSVPVWIGPRRLSYPDLAISTYRKLSTQHGMRSNVGPASPGQVRAGAPEGSYLFQDAWAASIMPAELKAPPLQTLLEMKDVLAELKSFRSAGRLKYTQSQKNMSHKGEMAESREPHLFWTGSLEVATEDTLPHSRLATYWR